MIDTLTLSRELTKAGLESAIADAIATGIQQAAEHGDHVTSDQFKAGIASLRTEIAEHRAEQRTEIAEHRAEQRTEIAGVRTEIAGLDAKLADVRAEISRSESRIIKWMVGTVLTGAGIVTAAGVAVGIAILRALAALA